MMSAASEEMEKYFSQLDDDLMKEVAIAKSARKQGFDPEDDISTSIARSMAERVEKLVATVAPQLVGSGITDRIKELEDKYGILAWEVALIIAEEVAEEKFCKFVDKREAMEVGIRVGFTYYTLGIVSAPLEGFVELKIKKRRDGKEYFALVFAGPIRGAGGSGCAISVLIGDYVRRKMGYATYDPDEKETSRFYTELEDYHERVTNLQYRPSKEEVIFLAQNIGVQIDGEPTEEKEVSNFKDLPRVETNRIRSGVCLVLSMIALKAPKMLLRVEKWTSAGKDFGKGWEFLKEFMKIQKASMAKKVQEKPGKGISPNYTYLADLVGGRPVISNPMASGGLRLRYGRSRITGFNTAGMHPLTQFLLNKYIASGTQLKVERPAKSAAITPCDTLLPPFVRLNDGTCTYLSQNNFTELIPQVNQIVYLGDILFSYGDFSEAGHKLVPPGYCEEWWSLEVLEELRKRGTDISTSLESLDIKDAEKSILNSLEKKPSFEVALKVSKKLNVPMHPVFTFFWTQINISQLDELLTWLKQAKYDFEDQGNLKKIVLPYVESPKRVLELLAIPHQVAHNEFVVIENDNAKALLSSLSKELPLN